LFRGLFPGYGYDNCDGDGSSYDGGGQGSYDSCDGYSYDQNDGCCNY